MLVVAAIFAGVVVGLAFMVIVANALRTSDRPRLIGRSRQGYANARDNLADLSARCPALRVRPVGEEASLAYRLVSTQDFVLDGKELARTGAKVALQGFCAKKGAEGRLFPSQMQVAFVTQGGTSASLGLVLLTDDAPRELRAYFLLRRDA
jgi:hypothetical protein